jgi:hypothetical protein
MVQAPPAGGRTQNRYSGVGHPPGAGLAVKVTGEPVPAGEGDAVMPPALLHAGDGEIE